MGLKKKINFDVVGKKLIDDNVKKLRLMGSEIIVGITARTHKGKDINNKSFKKYTKDYAKKKKKEYGSSKPNLTASGDMLGSMNTKDIKNGIRIYFLGTEERKKAKGNLKKRKFFGLDKKQIRVIRTKLNKIK